MSYGSTPPPSPYGAGVSPVPPPAAHQVVVKPTLGTVLGQTILGVLLLLLGSAAVAGAIVRPPAEGRGVALVVGGAFVLLGLLVCLSLKQTLRTQTYTFTPTGLEGQDAAGRPFRLPWSDLESIAVEAWEKRSIWSLMAMRNHRPRYGYLLFTVRPRAELTGTLARWTKWKQVRLRFWHREELLDSLAYGCRTFAGPKYHGVILH